MVKNVANGNQNPFVVYAQLGAVIGAIAYSVVNYSDFDRIATDPYARPLAFTSKDGDKLNSRIEDLEHRQTEDDKALGQLTGRNEARFSELYRRLQTIESKIDNHHTDHN